ncbi:Protein of unknown function DUF2089 [Thermaerobacter marianensis DSM 12885]|uniref:DUF2089 domain-containing protein n=1 Tax=Thermaerobacter marianensis (strain ATCC 700841 / DSM 12885 / JCM 10246 / 7p75a) TaxID=644966 RepID=E6SMR6_THEM7|nr:DUF2089 domain-containing protein [Thermaerobacter marianensis]ADU51558.1 Protein of unknown function DUF2089 [Thermaerobacter marianensis DSM 12885]
MTAPFEVPARCPNCGSVLEVREVVCGACDTQIRAHYHLSPFDLLDPEQRRFALLFLRAAGNLREMERLLGVSYPTVRKKLDEIIEALGGPAATSEPDAGSSGSGTPAGPRQAILERVRRGELSVDEALALLGRLESGDEEPRPDGARRSPGHREREEARG